MCVHLNLLHVQLGQMSLVDLSLILRKGNEKSSRGKECREAPSVKIMGTDTKAASLLVIFLFVQKDFCAIPHGLCFVLFCLGHSFSFDRCK